jgi:hypothetical protein
VRALKSLFDVLILASLHQPFDCYDGRAINPERGYQAGSGKSTIEQHRTRAALAAQTTGSSTTKTESQSKQVDEQVGWLDFELSRLSVQHEVDRHAVST